MTDDVAYNSLGEKGRDLVSDINIRRSLSILYAHDYALIKHIEQIDRDFILLSLQPYYSKNFKDFNLFQSATPIDYDEISQDPVYIGNLEWLRDNRILSSSRYQKIKDNVETLIISLNEKIQKNE